MSSSNRVDERLQKELDLKALLLLMGFALSLNAHAKPAALISCVNPLSIEQINDATKTLHDLKLNPSVEYRVNQQKFIKDPRYQNIAEFYHSCVQPQLSSFDLDKLTEQQTDTLFEALKRINFYTPRTDITDFLLRILNQKTNKQKSATYNYKLRVADIYRAMVNLRQFKQAKQLAAQYPEVELPALPKHISSMSYSINKTLLNLNESGQQLHKVKFAPEYDNYVVIVSSPNCFASNRFIDWLFQAQNAELTSQIINKLHFVTPPSDILFSQRLTKLNQQYAQLDMQTAFAKADWPEINYWGTPTMYFYENGELVRQIVGWPKDERAQEQRKQELLETLAEIKLLN